MWFPRSNPGLIHPLSIFVSRLNAEFLNMLFDHKPSGRYMLTSDDKRPVRESPLDIQVFLEQS